MRFRSGVVPTREDYSQSNETPVGLFAECFRSLQLLAKPNVPGFVSDSALVGRIPVDSGSGRPAPRVHWIYKPLPNSTRRTRAGRLISTRVSGIPSEGAAMDLAM